ncbi:MAG: phosphatase PAP2 family protein [Bradyrhizobium sp.]|uniref:phosphatase PAP2 family protein n=1 Tax=unclassified Bradyrhizobium TaxID=2631580 RepID=UPI00070D7E22|nr:MULTISPECIES: phosphatase PAP2 family protein [unclassified Bradyrhizobium]KQT16252.1 hypothetical protein ASG57_31750 [Bradyrhizobium sp. Leaf396]
MRQGLDIALTQWLNSSAGHRPMLDWFMIGVTDFTIPVMVLAVAVRWWQREDRANERMLAVDAGLTFLFGLLINQFILLFVSRLRPYELGITHLIVARSSDPSFPSDHATAAMAIVAATLLQHRRLRALILAIPAALLMVSRIYVGTHYVSDVVGGMGTALLAAIVMRATVALRQPITEVIIRFP